MQRTSSSFSIGVAVASVLDDFSGLIEPTLHPRKIATRRFRTHFGSDAVDKVDEFFVGFLLQFSKATSGVDVFGA